MLTYWSITLSSRWQRDLRQRSKCWGFVFLLLWSLIFESYCLVGFCLSGLRALRSFCLSFQFPFRREVKFCPCEFTYCGRHYRQFVYILCAGWRHPKLFNLGVLCVGWRHSKLLNLGVLSQTFNVLLLVILSLLAEIICKCTSIDVSLSFIARHGFTCMACVRPCN